MSLNLLIESTPLKWGSEQTGSISDAQGICILRSLLGHALGLQEADGDPNQNKSMKPKNKHSFRARDPVVFRHLVLQNFSFLWNKVAIF